MDKPIIRVRDVMQSEVISIDGMASVSEAAAIMRKKQISELLVNKRNEDDAWGIITISDIIKRIIIPGREDDDVLVYEIMTKPVLAVPAKMDIRYAVRLIHRSGVHRAPVELGEDIIGMVTLSSLILDNDFFLT